MRVVTLNIVGAFIAIIVGALGMGVGKANADAIVGQGSL